MYELLIDIILHILNIEVEVIRKCNVIHPIITSNHISEFDPVVLFYVLRNDKIRYIAGTEVIKKVPIFNAICEFFKVIFIEKNKQLASEALTRELKCDDTICIFPEGTLLYKSSSERSDVYCEKTGFPKFKNVLAPRETGFTKIQEIMNRNGCKYTDITLIYDVDTRQLVEPMTIMEMLRLRPKKVKVIIDESDLSITETFRRKDDLIETYRNVPSNSFVEQIRLLFQGWT